MSPMACTTGSALATISSMDVELAWFCLPDYAGPNDPRNQESYERSKLELLYFWEPRRASRLAFLQDDF